MSIYAPDVSVVIPTVGRPELKRAIDSVLSQSYEGRIEIVVVFDLPEDGADINSVRSAATGAHSILFTGGGRRAGHARNLGIEHSSGEWIAFLDDDDFWLPQKLNNQFRIVTEQRQEGKTLVVGSRAIQRSESTSETRDITNVPRTLIRPDETIERYLFMRRRPGGRRNSFFAPTILIPRSICLRVRWDEGLKRHQDWDWLVRLGQEDGVCFAQDSNIGAIIAIGSGGSISAGIDWEESFAWASRTLRPIDKQVYAEFLAAQTLRYALHSRSMSGLMKIGAALFSSRSLPSLPSLLVGMAGALRRSALERLMHRLK